MYVITVARTGPTSAISAKKSTNAIAVHTTASPRTDQIALHADVSLGRLTSANGTYATAVTAYEAEITPSAGRPATGC
jgi:hypothetical protein